MWFEIIPSFAIITVALSLPGLGLYGIHVFNNGNPYRRNMDERWNRLMYIRDTRLTGDPYTLNGLESIPDEEGKRQDI